MNLRSLLRSGRRGSLVVMALVFLFVLGIVILVYHWSSISTHKMFHHAYYSEKAVALIDGLTAIARGVTQDNLDDMIETLEVGKQKDLTGEVTKIAEDVKLIDKDDVEAKKQIQPKFSVTVTMLKKDPFKEEYSTLKPDEKEMTGKLEIAIEVGFQGFLTDFSTGKKVAKSQYEWKKLRAMPNFFRHFSLFVKNGIVQPEQEDDYAGQSSNFNNLVNDRTGQATSGGAVFVQSSTMNALPADKGKLPKVKDDKKKNPFYNQLAYVYLGSKDGKSRTYLNLTAGGGGGTPENTEKSQFGEDFQLYRGKNTDFYRVVSTEFSNFIESPASSGDSSSSDSTSTGRTKLSFRALWNNIKSAFSAIGDFFKKALKLFGDMDALEGDPGNLKSSNLPLYYVVRKDYGYASEWGDDPKYRKFGFGQGKVVSNSLHLYNQNWNGSTPCPTVVLGNVYRRCLSLSGYKQRRNMDDPSKDRQFEVQAGPIEYFKDVNELLKRTVDWSKPENGGGPVWVWDARVDWSFNDQGDGSDSAGTYIPISGAGLFGRLVPGLKRFWDEDKTTANKLFMASIAPPDRLMGGTSEGDTTIFTNNTDVEDTQKVSPIYVMFDKAAGFELSGMDIYNAGDHGRLFGAMGNKVNSPYFEEMMRNFCFTSAAMSQTPMASKLNGDAKKAVKDGGDVWGNIINAYEDTRTPDSVKKKFVQMDPGAVADAGKKQYWAGNKAPDNIYPWSLPDPWSDVGNHSDDDFQKVLQSTSSQKLFEKYFKTMMTNPGRVLPYNYSMRFWFEDLKDIFAMAPKDRLQLLGRDIIPEIRDGAFGYIEGSGNDYMKAKDGETTDPPLGDDVLADIAKKRQADKTLQAGYFFMDDWKPGTLGPSKVDLGDIYPTKEHYCYEEMDQKQFEDRFLKTASQQQGSDGSQTIGLNSVVKVKNFSLGNCTVVGGGAIISENTEMKITGNIKSKGSSTPLILKAQSFDIDPSVDTIEAMLVCTKEFRFKGARECTITGSLIAETWDPASWTGQSGAQKKIVFNPTYLTDPEKPPYVCNLEPRVRKFVIEGQALAQ